jgi:branched-chain amino acid transport system ATP-binding protein
MILEVRGLQVKYGNVQVLHGLDLSVAQGEIVAILGANGAGKSTTLNTICGLIRPFSGEILFEGEPIHRLAAFKIVERKITQAPEGRRIFGTLTVRENLNLGAFTSQNRARVKTSLAWIFELFPRLAERHEQLAGTLSGGEQQMLAIGRALMANPRLLLLDEPSLGLAPVLAKQIFKTIKTINKTGVTVVLVEQNARMALKLAHRGYVMELGKIVMEDAAPNLLENPDVMQAYLGGAGE